MSTYDPSWQAAGSSPSIGEGTLTGTYVNSGGVCTFELLLEPATDTNGGTGALSFSLPVATATSSAGVGPAFPCWLLTGDGRYWTGVATANPGSLEVSPFFPTSSTDAASGQLQNATSGGHGGTGVPLVPSSYPLVSGSQLVIAGSYLT